MTRSKLMFALLWLLVPMQQLYAIQYTESDREVELQWQDQVIDTVVVGDIIWLKDGRQRPFFGIYAEAEESKGTVILMHNMTRHPNWPTVIAPLRRFLLEHGWSTFSLQMPVLGAECGGRAHEVLLNESPARLDAAIDYLTNRGENKIVLLGHGLGAIMGAHYVRERSGQDFAGLVLVGLYMFKYTDPRMYVAKYLDKLQLPMLDIYGSEDLLVANDATERAEAVAQGGNRRYQQEVIKGAGIDFQGHEDELLTKVAHWLKSIK